MWGGASRVRTVQEDDLDEQVKQTVLQDDITSCYHYTKRTSEDHYIRDISLTLIYYDNDGGNVCRLALCSLRAGVTKTSSLEATRRMGRHLRTLAKSLRSSDETPFCATHTSTINFPSLLPPFDHSICSAVCSTDL